MRAAPALLVALLLAACGGESDADRVRDTVERFGAASARHDYQQICDELISPQLAAKVEEIGLPCELAFKRGLEDVRKPKLTVRGVQVRKNRALATVHSTAAGQKPSDDVVELVKEDGQWRISALARPQPQPPPRTTP